MAAPQSLREQRFARAMDREIAPVWHDRFARLIYRYLPTDPELFVLDAHCGLGRTTTELLARMHPTTRVLGLEPDAAMRAMAKTRIDPQWKERVYFREGHVSDIAEMGEDTYDVLTANLLLGEAHDLPEMLREFVRVVRPGGFVLATLALDGTWGEAEDLFREVLTGGKHDAAGRRLRRLRRMRKSGPDLARLVGELGIGPDNFVIEHERFELMFGSGREFLFAPVVEYGPLPAWKAILGTGVKPQEIFWQLKETIDAYFSGGVLAVSVVAGVLVIRVPEEGSAGAQAAADTAGEYWSRYPTLDSLFQRAERGETPDDSDLDLEIDLDLEDEELSFEELEAVQPSASSSQMAMSAEDEAIFALLDGKGRSEGDEELDSLLDQVLEFANTPDARDADADELEPEDLEEIGPSPELERKPGDTLSRIRSLLPPPPPTGRSKVVPDAKKLERTGPHRKLPPLPRKKPPGKS